MKIISYAIFFAAVYLYGYVYLAAPTTTAFGAAGLVIKGAELQSQIRKADAQEAVEASLETTWDASLSALIS